MFKRLLIANRGEIAVRIARTCRRLGVRAVVVYSEADRGALHTRVADEAVCIGPAEPGRSYLNIDAILEAARRTGAEAVHPGYGFLAENADFAAACAAAGLAFVGPGPEALRLSGDKAEARRVMAAAGISVVPGADGLAGLEALRQVAGALGYPLMVKAIAGGGGRGMRLVSAPEELGEALEAARREAESAFGDGRLLVERLVPAARHVEAQIIADTAGAVAFLGERECSIQRRHQKVVEETPSPAATPALRERLAEAAVAAARAVGYANAGTVEFLLAPDGAFYFLEVNARLQVEHPVTELVTGLDLVELQLRVAADEPLPAEVLAGEPRGHAIEYRLYAEDPFDEYRPKAGRISLWRMPEGARVDAGYAEGDTVPAVYDTLLAKIVVAGGTREEALQRSREALARTLVGGLQTNLPLLRAIAASSAFAEGHTTTRFLEEELPPDSVPRLPPLQALAVAAALLVLPGASEVADPWLALGAWRLDPRREVRLRAEGQEATVALVRLAGHPNRWRLAADGEERELELRRAEGGVLLDDGSGGMLVSGEVRPEVVAVDWGGTLELLEREAPPSFAAARRTAGGLHGSVLRAPMPGVVVRVLVEVGQPVHARQTLVLLEAMKMEHALAAAADGRVAAVHCRPGTQVEEGEPLVELDLG